MANDIDVYDYTDGIFLGRYNTEAYAGEASCGVGSDPLTTPPDDIPTADLAYRVDTQFYNSLYVTDVNKKYVKPRTTDISKNLLIHAYNTLQDQTGKNITRTKIIDKNDVEHNALDVCDFSGINYLSTIYNKFFNPDKAFIYGEGPYIDVFTDRSPDTFYWYDGKWADDYSGTQLGFGSSTHQYDSSGIFSSIYNSNQKLRQLMTCDYSANKKYLQLYNTFMTYTKTQQLRFNYSQPTNENVSNSTTPNNNYNTGIHTAIDDPQTSTMDTKFTIIITPGNNKLSTYVQNIDLTNIKVNSISFYGTVNKACKICVVYIYKSEYVSTEGFTSNKNFYIVEQTQYDTSVKKSGITKFGFNIDRVNAQYVTLVFRDINDNSLIRFNTLDQNSGDLQPVVYASYSYKNI
jgi:hypothetical protein